MAVGAFAVNAVIYEQLGSVSTFVFGLPVLRQLPQRVPAVARYFAVDHVPEGARDAADRTDPPTVYRL